MTTVHRVLIVILAAALAMACENPSSPIAPTTAEGVLATDAGHAAGAHVPRHQDGRVSLCHVTGLDTYELLTISKAAEAPHRAHGDGAVGEPIANRPGMVFGAGCVVEAAGARPFITTGSWVVSLVGAPPLARFALEGPNLSLTGSWTDASVMEICITCEPHRTISPTLVFTNPTPMTDVSFARGRGTVSGTSYDFLEFGGSLAFEADPVKIPTAPAGDPPQLVTVTTPFRVSGNLMGFEVLGLREPRLVFDVPVAARGIATLEWLTTPTGMLSFYRLTFAFGHEH